MTIWELIRVLLRYWPVVVVGALCTSAASFAALSDEGVYITRTEIVFLAPVSTRYPNALRTQSDDLIVTAGVIGKRSSGPARVTKFADPSVTPVGLGMREGWTLRLPDTGGQWATNFATQRLVLDVVGPSESAVQAQVSTVIQRVQHELHEMQRDANVDPINYIVALPAPEMPHSVQVKGNRTRVLGMTAALGIGLTVAVVLHLDRFRKHRKMLVAMANSSDSPEQGT